jgi:hypothetical protein
MRRILLLLSCVCIVLTVNSCSDFLSQQPQTLASSTAFDTKEGAYKELMAVYHRTMINQAFSFFWGIGDVAYDDARKGGIVTFGSSATL